MHRLAIAFVEVREKVMGVSPLLPRESQELNPHQRLCENCLKLLSHLIGSVRVLYHSNRKKQ